MKKANNVKKNRGRVIAAAYRNRMKEKGYVLIRKYVKIENKEIILKQIDIIEKEYYAK